jgi:chemotaxis protein CheD
MLAASLRSINVGMGELIVSKEDRVLTCVGLGSCIVLCAYDPMYKIGGIAHMLLPSCRKKCDITSSPVKYIDSGVPALISRIVKNGAEKSNLIIKIAGGAKMLSIPGENSLLDVGQRNINEIKTALARENLKICGSDLGGNYGRSIQFYLDTGRITVRSVSGRIIDL